MVDARHPKMDARHMLLKWTMKTRLICLFICLYYFFIIETISISFECIAVTLVFSYYLRGLHSSVTSVIYIKTYTIFMLNWLGVYTSIKATDALSACLPACLPACLSVSVCLSLSLSVCPKTYLCSFTFSTEKKTPTSSQMK